MMKTSRTTDDPIGHATVCLICMPSSGIERPSISLGLLKAILEKYELDSEVIYANLWFMDYVGLNTCRALDIVPPQRALVDWIFGKAAFPDFELDHEAYLKRIDTLGRYVALHGLTRERLLGLRDRMVAFIDWAAHRILARRPKVVGCTSTFQQHVASLAILRRIREIDPTIVTMMGGANCESVMGRTTHKCFPWVDFVVSGEADQFVGPLIRRIVDGGPDMSADELPFGVFGPVHRTSGYPTTLLGDGTPRAITEDIRDLPLPDYSDYFAELKTSLYAGQIRPGLPMEFSRGCWWGAKSHCTFCGLNGGTMAYRAKSPDRVTHDIDTMTTRYGYRKVEAVDNIMDMAYFKTVLPELAERDEKYELFFETKSNLKKAHIKALADAGVRWIQPGVESLSSPVLALMRKGCTAAQNILLLKWCRQYRVRVSWSIITEFPGEDDAWYDAMAAIMPSLFHLQPGITIALRYDRYSPYFMAPENYGLTLRPAELYRYAYPLNEDDLFNQVYFFENHTSAPNEAVDRPGLFAVRGAVAQWGEAWGTEPPTLTMEETAEGLQIEDTREGGARTVLTGLAREVLLACDEGPAEVALLSSFDRLGHEAAEISEVIDRLLEQRLMVRVDRRLIGLVLRGPVMPLPAPSTFPGGYILSGQGVVERFLASL